MEAVLFSKRVRISAALHSDKEYRILVCKPEGKAGLLLRIRHSWKTAVERIIWLRPGSSGGFSRRFQSVPPPHTPALNAEISGARRRSADRNQRITEPERWGWAHFLIANCVRWYRGIMLISRWCQFTWMRGMCGSSPDVRVKGNVPAARPFGYSLDVWAL
jgi:hypothetical protein